MENIKTIALSLILFTAVVGALVWFGNRGNEPETAAVGGLFGGALTAEETAYDFGSAPIGGGFIGHKYLLENKSDKAVKIGAVSTSCMCTTAQVTVEGKTYGPFGMPGHGGGSSKANVIVSPGEKITVKATFDPAAHGPAGIGAVERAIFVDTGAAEPLVLTFKVNVTP